MSKSPESSTPRIMPPTQAALGIWSGGHYLHFGEDIGSERLKHLVRHSYEAGIRTFVTADVYGEGAADKLLGEALAEFPRDSYCLVGAIGHDFYKGTRQGEKGYPRFTDPALRESRGFARYLHMAAHNSLERLRTDHFDLLMLHNPDSIGYTSDEVWTGLSALRAEGLTGLLGIAPGPANGFTLDLIGAFEKFGPLIDWAMIILNPLEPWPGRLCLPAAEKHNVKLLTRVVEYGGLFHDTLRPGAKLSRTDHRSFRPAGWIETAEPKMEQMRQIARDHEMTLLQLAGQWALAQPAVECIVPTLIQEAGPGAKPIEDQAAELARIPAMRRLPPDVAEKMTAIGNNSNTMSLKGGSSQYLGAPQADMWPLTPELLDVAKRWDIEPDRHLYYSADARDIREKGLPARGVVQAMDRRLFCQFHAFTKCRNLAAAVLDFSESGLEGVLYEDLNDPFGFGMLVMSENPDSLLSSTRALFQSESFKQLQHKPEFTMLGRTYAAGREPDLEEWLFTKPRATALNPEWPWAIWYPLRRKSEFAMLSDAEQGKILMEHAMIGRNYGQAGYAHDIRLACYGLDRNDNEFILGIVGPELYPLSRLVQDMRKTQQTAKYIQSLGPFFVGKARWQSPLVK